MLSNAFSKSSNILRSFFLKFEWDMLWKWITVKMNDWVLLSLIFVQYFKLVRTYIGLFNWELKDILSDKLKSWSEMFFNMSDNNFVDFFILVFVYGHVFFSPFLNEIGNRGAGVNYQMIQLNINFTKSDTSWSADVYSSLLH